MTITQDQFAKKAKEVLGAEYNASKVQFIHVKGVEPKTPLEIHEEATKEAKKAVADFIAKHGEPFYCGFAWVNICDGRSAFAKALKKAGIASKSYSKGFDVWNPSGHPTQSMDAKEQGAYAYAEVLRKYGIKCYAQSRAD